MTPPLNPTVEAPQVDQFGALVAEISAEHEAGEAAFRKGLEHFRKANQRLLEALRLLAEKEVPRVADKDDEAVDSPAGSIRLLTLPEVARLIRLGVRTVRSKAAARMFPHPLMLANNRPRWRIEDIKKWLEDRTKARTNGRRRQPAARS